MEKKIFVVFPNDEMDSGLAALLELLREGWQVENSCATFPDHYAGYHNPVKIIYILKK